MRLAWLAVLLVVPGAGGIGFVELEAPDAGTCGEGCLVLAPGERILRISPAAGHGALWLAEDPAGLPLATGVVLEPAFVELPEGAARLRVTVL